MLAVTPHPIDVACVREAAFESESLGFFVRAEGSLPAYVVLHERDPEHAHRAIADYYLIRETERSRRVGL